MIEGHTYDIDANEGKNSLHGGSHGFHSKYFFGPVTSYDSKAEAVKLKFVDFDSDGSIIIPSNLVFDTTQMSEFQRGDIN